MTLPQLKYYYYASQLVPLLCWCNEDYRARWEEFESKMVTAFPLQALVGERGLVAQLGEANYWLNLTLKKFGKVVNLTQIDKMLNLFRWCAFDTEFPPNWDCTFKSWIKKGLTTYLKCTENTIFQSFQFMQSRYVLRKEAFFSDISRKTLT